MRKLPEYQRRLIEPGFRLGPFAFRSKIDSLLYRQSPYKDFAHELREHFPHLPKKSLTESIVKTIYERCMEAKAQKEMHQLARRITTTNRWKRSRRQTAKLMNLLGTYVDFDLERRMRAAQNDAKRPQVQTLASGLLSSLRELEKVAEWWEGFAEFEKWLNFYRGYVFALDSRLKQRQLSQFQRAEIIAVAFEILHVRKTSDDGILKTLRREQKQPRRFVLGGRIEIQETQYTIGPVGRKLATNQKRRTGRPGFAKRNLPKIPATRA